MSESKHTPETALALAGVAIFDRGIGWQADATATLKALAAEVERLKSALTKISGIRDSMIGCQKVNWSEHVYPLVAALDAAGFEGASYEVARDQIGTLLERTNKAEAEVERLRASERRAYAALDKACGDVTDLRRKVEALEAELAMRRKSGSAVDRLHNLCEGIAADADGSEWSREEWERIDAENVALRRKVEALEAALRFYAQRKHFALSDADAWDTVSGEPQNYWCDDAGTATVEDGTIARAALAASQKGGE